ncbi:MAG: hypothetical protein P8X79_19135 [Reinekea sp.]
MACALRRYGVTDSGIREGNSRRSERAACNRKMNHNKRQCLISVTSVMSSPFKVKK